MTRDFSKITIRGIRDPMPANTILGRVGTDGAPHPIDLTKLSTKSYVAQTTIGPGTAAGGDLGGTYPNPIVVALQTNPVKSGTLGSGNDGQVLTWVNADNEWEAKALPIASTTVFGIAKVDGVTITAPGGILTAAASGGITIGSGAPSALAAAGSIYSRSDIPAIYSSQPVTINPAQVQHGIQDNRSAVNLKGVTFGSNVTAGNLLVAVLYDGGDGGTPFAAASGWTLQTSASQGANSFIAVYTRTAASGDLTTPPNCITSNPATGSVWMFLELGPGITYAGNLDTSNGAGQASGSTTTAASITTSQINDLVYIFLGQTPDPIGGVPVASGYTLVNDGAYFSDSAWFGSQSPASAGAVTSTITWSGAYTTACYMQLAFKGSSTAAWDLLSSAINPMIAASLRF